LRLGSANGDHRSQGPSHRSLRGVDDFRNWPKRRDSTLLDFSASNSIVCQSGSDIMNEFRKGQAPYGFRWKDGSLEVVPGEAQTRKLAFEHFVKLRSKGAVARKLNELGRFTRREGKWSDMQVGRILGCSSAIGRYVAASERGASLTADSSVADPDASFIACPPLIPLDLWNQVRTMLSKVAEPEGESKGAKTERLFVGLIFCECGERMQLPSDGKKYGCPACHRKIGLPELEKIFVEDLTELVGDHPRFQAALTATPADLDLAAAESNLAEASAERGRLEELMIGGVISAKRYGELEAVSQDRIKTAGNQVKELRKRKAVSESPKISETEPATTFEKRWNRLSVAGRNRIARAFVDRLIVGDDAVELTYLISDSTSKDAPLAQQTRSPTNQAETSAESEGPLYIRLPKPGQLCEVSGLSRAKLNELILPSDRNHFRPPVESKSLRKPGQTKGVRLILRGSLLAYLRTHGS
jgi:hypothetical protein